MGQGWMDDGGEGCGGCQGLCRDVVVVDLGDVDRGALEHRGVATAKAHAAAVAPAVPGPPHGLEGDGVSEGRRRSHEPVGMALLQAGDKLEGVVAKGSHRARPCSAGRGLGL